MFTTAIVPNLTGQGITTSTLALEAAGLAIRVKLHPESVLVMCTPATRKVA